MLTVIGIKGYTHGVRLVRMPPRKRAAKVPAETPADRPSPPPPLAAGPTLCVKKVGRKGSATPIASARTRRGTHFVIAAILIQRALTRSGSGYNRPD